jgi:hypothetical protein
VVKHFKLFQGDAKKRATSNFQTNDKKQPRRDEGGVSFLPER